VLVRGDGRDREDAASESLAEDVDVGHDVLVVTGEGPPGAREAGLDLVGDHEDTAGGAQHAELAQVAVWRDDDATLALDRLEEDGDRRVVDELVDGRD